MIGLAASPGTDVLPMCSMRDERLARRRSRRSRSRSRSNRSGQRVVVGDDDRLAACARSSCQRRLRSPPRRCAAPSSMPSGRHASSKSNFGWWCGQMMPRAALPPPSMKYAPGARLQEVRHVVGAGGARLADVAPARGSAAATPATSAAHSASFTHGRQRRCVELVLGAPRGRDAAQDLVDARAARARARRASNVRIVPDIITSFGMMLPRTPPSMRPTVSTAVSRRIDGAAHDGLQRGDRRARRRRSGRRSRAAPTHARRARG